MGVETIVYLRGSVEAEAVFAFIKKIDVNAKLVKSYCKEISNILFSYKGEDRDIFCHENARPDLEFYRSIGLDELAFTSKTCLRVGAWGYAEEFMLKITKHFGGWFDADDCDSNPPEWVEGEIKHKPIRKVTWQEVYEKFGEKVIII